MSDFTLPEQQEFTVAVTTADNEFRLVPDDIIMRPSDNEIIYRVTRSA